jgi:hypothetical protein
MPTEAVTAQTLAKIITISTLVPEHSAKTSRTTAVTKCHTFAISLQRALHFTFFLKKCSMRLHFFKVHQNPDTRRGNKFIGFEVENFGLTLY